MNYMNKLRKDIMKDNEGYCYSKAKWELVQNR